MNLKSLGQSNLLRDVVRQTSGIIISVQTMVRIYATTSQATVEQELALDLVLICVVAIPRLPCLIG
jgi:hypothetical protein